MDDDILVIEHLKKYYRVGKTLNKSKGVLKAVDDVSFSIRKGSIFGIVGESGCGKSTLGRCILRLVEPSAGNIFFKGENISSIDQRRFRHYRKNMQMVFQNPYSSFNPKKKIGDAFSSVGRVYRIPKEKLTQKTEELLSYINLPKDVLKRRPNELSGGQLQRLAIARALLLEPAFLLADEPVSALDVSVQAQILNLILDLRDSFHLTMFIISHDLAVVENICDEAVVLYLGKIMEKAPIGELFGKDSHPYTKALIAAMPKCNPQDKSERILLTGDIPNAIDLPVGCRFAPRCPCFKPGICDQSEPELKEVSSGHFIACHNFS